MNPNGQDLPGLCRCCSANWMNCCCILMLDSGWWFQMFLSSTRWDDVLIVTFHSIILYYIYPILFLLLYYIILYYIILYYTILYYIILYYILLYYIILYYIYILSLNFTKNISQSLRMLYMFRSVEPCSNNNLGQGPGGRLEPALQLCEYLQAPEDCRLDRNIKNCETLHSYIV